MPVSKPARKETAPVVVVGGGVVGLAAARRLALEGMAVTVVEREVPAHGATWASAGMLSPLGERLEEGPFLDLGVRSLEEYPDFVAALETEAEMEVGYRRSGKVQVARKPEEGRALKERAEWGRLRGFETEWLEGRKLRRRFPQVTPSALGGMFIPGDHQVENRALGEALHRAVVRAGGIVEGRTAVTRLLVEEAGANRVRGVQVEGGRVVEASWVVLAAGAWSARLPGLPRPLSVRPVRGQMVALRPESLPWSRMIADRAVYLVPRGDGRVLAGSTEEDAGFANATTVEGVRSLLDGAVGLVPSLGEAEVTEVWAGLRPGTPDRRPILGPDPEVEGLVYATGHFRNGILLAPATAELVSDLILGRPPSIPLHPFSPTRFRGTGPDPDPDDDLRPI